MARYAWILGGAALVASAAGLVVMRVSRTTPAQNPTPPATAHLDPSADEGDVLALDQMRRRGDDLSRPRPVSFYIYFPAEQPATSGCDRATARGFDAHVRAPWEPSAPWLCLATRTLSPSAESLRAARAELVALATPLGGDYDGWDSPPPGPQTASHSP
jgi:hypothetical protein